MEGKMEEGRDNTFSVDTKGTCFLCLQAKVPLPTNGRTTTSSTSIGDVITISDMDLDTEEDPPPPPPPLSKCSFRQMSRYLNVDISKVFNLSSPVQTTSVLENSEIFVSLCRSCSGLMTRCCAMYKELDILRRRITLCVQKIHQVMTSAENNTELLGEYRKCMVASNPAELIQICIAENLRKETKDKCSERIKMKHGKRLVNKGSKNPQANSGTSQKTQSSSPVEAPSVVAPANPNSNTHFQNNYAAESGPGNIEEVEKEDEEQEELMLKLDSIMDGNGQKYYLNNDTGTIIPSSSAVVSNEVTLSKDLEDLLNMPPSLAGASNIGAPMGKVHCLECGKFISAVNFEAHKRLHTGEKPYQCINCKMKFLDLRSLKTHSLRDHRSQLFLSLKDPKITNEQFEGLVKRLLEDITKITNGERLQFTCTYCGKQYRQKHDAEAHLTLFHYDDLAAKLLTHQKELNFVNAQPKPVLPSLPSTWNSAAVPNQYQTLTSRVSGEVSIELIDRSKTTHGPLSIVDKDNARRQTSFDLPTSSSSKRSRTSSPLNFASRQNDPLTANMEPVVYPIRTRMYVPSIIRKTKTPNGRLPGSLYPRDPLTPTAYRSKAPPSHYHPYAPKTYTKPPTLKLKCLICGELFDDMVSLKAHGATHDIASKETPSEPPPLSCRYCGKKFRFHNGHRVHMLTFHRFEVFKKYLPQGTTSEQLDEAIPRIVKEYKGVNAKGCICSACKKEFPESQISQLQNHVLVVHFHEMVPRLRFFTRGFANDSEGTSSSAPGDVPVKVENDAQLILPHDLHTE